MRFRILAAILVGLVILPCVPAQAAGIDREVVARFRAPYTGTIECGDYGPYASPIPLPDSSGCR